MARLHDNSGQFKGHPCALLINDLFTLLMPCHVVRLGDFFFGAFSITQTVLGVIFLSVRQTLCMSTPSRSYPSVITPLGGGGGGGCCTCCRCSSRRTSSPHSCDRYLRSHASSFSHTVPLAEPADTRYHRGEHKPRCHSGVK